MQYYVHYKLNRYKNQDEYLLPWSTLPKLKCPRSETWLKYLQHEMFNVASEFLMSSSSHQLNEGLQCNTKNNASKIEV
ncbi:CLUMA_CG005055, isoform A [Clunio marinus]|uniref:CLUMA_CG005055, isoform A n=1 Tax=Clunio marinus TaxID=568069 RepID=A0A1J1HXX9_9DIPT|nr:CLUMA_CG005055, isoform A [Clunio marinus]